MIIMAVYSTGSRLDECIYIVLEAGLMIIMAVYSTGSRLDDYNGCI